LTNPADRVRRAAAEALGRLGPLARDAEPALRRALDDPEDLVRKAAAEALINLNLKK
jgi:HEAT repeat protein